MELNDSVTAVKGVGEKTAELFARVGVRTAGDLLEYYPAGYEVFEAPEPVASLQEGKTAAIEAFLTGSPQGKRIGKLEIINCQVRDYSGCISLTWFHMPFLQSRLKLGERYLFRGKVIRRNGALVMQQPKILTWEAYRRLLHVMQPVYPLTAGLTSRKVSKAVEEVLREADLSGDYLPASFRREQGLCSYKQAARSIHFPKNPEEYRKARKRLAFDEFFLFTAAVEQLKRQENGEPAPAVMKPAPECDVLTGRLPYRLTKAQRRVWEEIKNDMCGGLVMNRLVQGDVGSGKTILAALALLLTARNGYQGAMMVPTEVLAKQHFETLSGLLEPLGVHTVLLTGSMTAKEKREACRRIREQEVSVIVGTHALIQEKVEYAGLALAVTDEQHRFGVRQRLALSEKGERPHVLVMSATPIPRTLAVILYGDLDLSVLDELPQNRLPVKNCVVDTRFRPAAFRFIEEQVREGRQAYVICPMVEESEALEAENVIDYARQMKEQLSDAVRVEYLHGKMKQTEKNDRMERFAAGEIKVLVSTTVVEVGIDVPNASVILIENAERFGLAQLHQLRGRVGRGGFQSYCIFMNGAPSEETMERLRILEKSNDGFWIAGEDLRLRGPGDLFGIRQSGLLEFKIADIYQDAELLKAAGDYAKRLNAGEYRRMLEKQERLCRRLSQWAGPPAL